MLQEVFSDVRREESWCLVILTEGIRTEPKENSAFMSHGSHIGSGPVTTCVPNTGPGANPQKKRSWCDHCKKPGHSKDVCWEIHGKPVDWKPKQNRNRGIRLQLTRKKRTSQPKVKFSPQQLEKLYELFTSFYALGQSSTNIFSGSLARRGSVIVEDIDSAKECEGL